jgi:hypothetical protein
MSYFDLAHFMRIGLADAILDGMPKSDVRALRLVCVEVKRQVSTQQTMQNQHNHLRHDQASYHMAATSLVSLAGRQALDWLVQRGHAHYQRP